MNVSNILISILFVFLAGGSAGQSINMQDLYDAYPVLCMNDSGEDDLALSGIKLVEASVRFDSFGAVDAHEICRFFFNKTSECSKDGKSLDALYIEKVIREPGLLGFYASLIKLVQTGSDDSLKASIERFPYGFFMLLDLSSKDMDINSYFGNFMNGIVERYNAGRGVFTVLAEKRRLNIFSSLTFVGGVISEDSLRRFFSRLSLMKSYDVNRYGNGFVQDDYITGVYLDSEKLNLKVLSVVLPELLKQGLDDEIVQLYKHAPSVECELFISKMVKSYEEEMIRNIASIKASFKPNKEE